MAAKTDWRGVYISVGLSVMAGCAVVIWPAQSVAWGFFLASAIATAAAVAHRYGGFWLKATCGLFAGVVVALMWFFIPHPGAPDDVLIEALRSKQKELAEKHISEQAIDAILAHWDQLKKAQTALEQRWGLRNFAERQAIEDQMHREIAAIRQSVVVKGYRDGAGLIIETAPNSFRVIFPVVMRTVPKVAAQNLPSGIAIAIIEPTTVGCTVIYTPTTIPIALKDVRLTFSADL